MNLKGAIRYYFLAAFIFLLIIVGYFLYDRYYKKNKYDDCIESCQKNNDCLREEVSNIEGDIVSNSYGKRQRTYCVEYSEASCNILCIKKYK